MKKLERFRDVKRLAGSVHMAGNRLKWRGAEARDTRVLEVVMKGRVMGHHSVLLRFAALGSFS